MLTYLVTLNAIFFKLKQKLQLRARKKTITMALLMIQMVLSLYINGKYMNILSDSFMWRSYIHSYNW